MTLFLTGLCHFCLYEKSFFVKHQPKLYLVDVWYQTSTKTLSGWCLISNVNQNCIWLMFDIKCQPELYLVDIWYQSSIRWLLVHDWYSYTLDICFLCISWYVDSKKGIQFWHFFDWTLSFFLAWKIILRHTLTKTVPGWCLISNVNQNSIWLMFDIKRQPELHLVDVWYQMSTRTLSGWYLISIINRVATGSWLISIYSSYVFSLHFRVCRFQKTYTILTLFLSFLLVWKIILHQTSTKTVPGWCLISNVNQNSIWLMFDIKRQPELHLVDVWYQMSTRTLSGWYLISIINRVATGSWLISIYSSYVFSLHFRVCRFQKTYTILTLFLSFLLVWKIILHQTSTKTVPGWCLISNVNQNSIWLMFDIKRQPELHLVDVWYQMSTRTLSGWYLISIINQVATGSWLIFIYSRYVFSLHFRVCRFKKTYTILTPFLTGLCHFCLYEKSYFVKHQPKLYLVDVWYQTSTKTLSGWCLISNVNQNCIWLMFDIKCQPELCLVDIWYQSSIGWLLVHDWYPYTLVMCFLCISGYVDSKKRIQFWHFFCHFCLYEKSYFVKHQPKLYLVDVWYQTSTKTLSGWCLISNVNQNCIWLMFDIKCQPELCLVDIWYQSSIRWLLVHGWYSYTLGMCFLCISGYVDSKKRIQFWHFFWLDFVIFACMKNHTSSNINQNCTWLMFDIKRQPKLYLVDVWYQTSTRTVSGWCLISIVKHQTSTVLRCRCYNMDYKWSIYTEMAIWWLLKLIWITCLTGTSTFKSESKLVFKK